jgi:hypothetical protein
MVSRRVGNARLLKLAAFLDKLPSKAFDYCVIVRGDEAPDPRDPDCGSTACAIGWMPKALPRLAKWEHLSQYASEDSDLAWEVIPRGDAEAPVFDARRRSYGRPSFATAGHVFGLDADTTEYLFNPAQNDLDSDAHPRDVARHIRQWVERHP